MFRTSATASIQALKTMCKDTLLGKDNRSKSYAVLENKPQALTNELLKKIGEYYHKDYPKGSRKSIFHSNHYLADQLIDCNLDGAYDRWQFLISIYAKLPNTSGKFGATLVFLVHYAFNTKVEFVIQNGLLPSIYKPAGVASQLEHAVCKFYADLEFKQHQ